MQMREAHLQDVTHLFCLCGYEQWWVYAFG